MKYFSIVISSALFLSACSNNEAAVNSSNNKAVEASNTYALAPVEKGGVATTIKLPGVLSAYQEISIFPKVNGYVKEVLVDIGTRVSKGTLLMTLEAPELVQDALQAKEKLAKADADYSIDKEHYMRYLEASQTAGAVSPLDLSSLKAKMEADVALCNAAKANWQAQQTLLGYLRVTAPFSGVITERNIHPGALVSAAEKNKPMLELKQIEHLRLQVDIPEGIAVSLKEKDTLSFYVSAMQGKKMVGTISRKSMNVNTQYRNERIEVDVVNKDGQLSAGMYADVLVNARGNANAFYVPRSAVVTSTERKYVLVSDNGKIRKVDVSTGNESMDKIEVFGNFKGNEQVIAKGNDEIKETE